MNDTLFDEVPEYFGRGELENIINADQPEQLEIWLEKHNLVVEDFE